MNVALQRPGYGQFMKGMVDDDDDDDDDDEDDDYDVDDVDDN